MRFYLSLIAILFSLSACSSLISSATSNLADSISIAVQNQNDIETVRDGAPAYLLMIDGLISGDPGNVDLLLAGAKLYSTYATAFVDDSARMQRLAEKAKHYGLRALCKQHKKLCQAVNEPYEQFLQHLKSASFSDVQTLYGFTTAWASWIQANSQDWAAIADIPKIVASMQRITELDEKHDGGGAHLYLGVLSTQLPPNLGGKPEQGRKHFERAIVLSKGQNLMAKVLYAKQYARLIFNQDLHDKLLKEVLDANPQVPGLTLINTLAQKQAVDLLKSSADYF